MTREEHVRDDVDSVRREADKAVEDAELRGSALVATRALHAAGAFIIVFGVSVLVGMPTDSSKEIALLTAGVGWFSTEATDRISTTIMRVFSPTRRH